MNFALRQFKKLNNMGQKIHPFGFRVGITKRHQTVWFARFQKRQYAQTVLEDIFLRKTLQKLLPELLKKKYNNADQIAKIAHIKIERGLIPYEIGIQIHAQNCEAIKAAIEKLEVNPNVLKNVLKTQFLLEKASVKESAFLTSKSGDNEKEALRNGGKEDGMAKTAMTRKGQMKKSFDKGFTKRRTNLQRFRERILENMLIIKKGRKITRRFQKADLKPFSRQSNSSSRFGKSRGRSFFEPKKDPNFQSRRDSSSKMAGTGDFSNLSTARLRSILTENREQSQKTTKFMNVFLTKMNQKFLTVLKADFAHWNQYLEKHKAQQLQEFGKLKYAPLGYSSKWNLARLKRYEKQPLSVLVKLLKLLQQQALRKLELLRREFLVLGTLPTTKSFTYFQRIRFIKALKTLIQQSKVTQIAKTTSSQSMGISRQKQIENEKFVVELKEKALNQKFTNLKNETRKIQLIEQLQQMVQKHRQKNLYLYLATIADARKYLRKIQNFTKQQANFLFGFNPSILEQMDPEQKREFMKAQLKKAIQKANRQNEFQRNLQEVFVRQVQQQKFIGEQNLALIPKISLKFYSLKPEIVETNASIVTDAIVDKIEKREAFRKVIKKVSEDLMKTNKVKGVKIQVSGRLNGAEIARSEWVRAGRVPLQTLRANIDYCYKTAQTIYGIIGVKVWIYRGYTKCDKNA
jgi:ribosomal protein S3